MLIPRTPGVTGNPDLPWQKLEDKMAVALTAKLLKGSRFGYTLSLERRVFYGKKAYNFDVEILRDMFGSSPAGRRRKRHNKTDIQTGACR